MMSELAIAHDGPSYKEKKYDRQLRLWGAHGQRELEKARVLLVNAGSGTVGIETLKNLVLPGIHEIAIYDDHVVNEWDLGVNFFLDESCLGKARSRCCLDLLKELNPDVKGQCYPKEDSVLPLQAALSSFRPSLILYSVLISQEDLARITKHAAECSIPLVEIQSAGFYAYFRISMPSPSLVVETHPEPEKMADLRLLHPWDELRSFAREMTQDIDTLDDFKHAHLPYVVILLHYLEKWKETHDGKYPTDYKSKLEFRKLITSAARTDNGEGGEENFEEAEAAVNKHVKPFQLEESVVQVFDQLPKMAPGDVLLSAPNAAMVIAGGISDFYRKHGVLPLSGTLPDMKAESSVYVRLQKIYREKARQDAQEVLDCIAKRGLDNLYNRTTGYHPSHDDDKHRAEMVAMVCKNAAFLKMMQPSILCSDLSTVLAAARVKDEEIECLNKATGMQMPLSLAPIYAALVASSIQPEATAEDIMRTIISKAPEAADDVRVRQAAEEVARSRWGELHNISAIVGGMVAQEVIKIITSQYIPVDNSCVFDGINSRCEVFRL